MVVTYELSIMRGIILVFMYCLIMKLSDNNTIHKKYNADSRLGYYHVNSSATRVNFKRKKEFLFGLRSLLYFLIPPIQIFYDTPESPLSLIHPLQLLFSVRCYVISNYEFPAFLSKYYTVLPEVFPTEHYIWVRHKARRGFDFSEHEKVVMRLSYDLKTKSTWREWTIGYNVILLHEVRKFLHTFIKEKQWH